MTPPTPRLDLLSRATIKVAPIQTIGWTPFGERRIVPILGGRFEGRLAAEILPGSADFQIITTDGTLYLEARYTIRTEDAALILVHNRGVRHATPDILAQLSRGDLVDPSQYYFRTTPIFETGNAKYAWLNKIVAVCSGARTHETVLLDFYEVL
jgi:hypothetical protein